MPTPCVFLFKIDCLWMKNVLTLLYPVNNVQPTFLPLNSCFYGCFSAIVISYKSAEAPLPLENFPLTEQVLSKLRCILRFTMGIVFWIGQKITLPGLFWNMPFVEDICGISTPLHPRAYPCVGAGGTAEKWVSVNSPADHSRIHGGTLLSGVTFFLVISAFAACLVCDGLYYLRD